MHRPQLVLCSLVLLAAPAAAQLDVPAAYPTIQAAVNAAPVDATINVAPGVYFENVVLTRGLTLRSVAGAASTVIDGSGAGSVIHANIQPGSGITDDLFIEGFTITNGAGTPHGGSSSGGGLFVMGAVEVFVRRCVFSGNAVTGFGGGIFAHSLPDVTDCLFANNTAVQGGGAIDAGVGSIDRCRFQQNTADVGGAIRCGGSFLSFVSISHSVLAGNQAVTSGGAIDVVGNVFAYGCTFADNLAAAGGGVHAATRSGPFPPGNSLVISCIVWGNQPDQIVHTGAQTLTVDHSDIQGGSAGSGNIDAAPLFLNPASLDYHLTAASPCRDAGTGPPPPFSAGPDVDGDPRPFDRATDMGADEYHGLLACGAGDVGTQSGGPFDVLLVGGSAGDHERRVRVPLGAAVTISVQQPATNPSPARFLIAGMIGVPVAADATPLPAGLGDLCIPLSILVPGDTRAFVLASSYGPVPVQLIPATPAPWSVAGPGLPFPFSFALQGLIDEDATTVRRTNGVILTFE